MAKTNQAEKAAAQKASVQKFTIEKLQANCRPLFGISTSTFAGATCGMTGKYSIEEMKTHIETWKRKGVN